MSGWRGGLAALVLLAFDVALAAGGVLGPQAATRVAAVIVVGTAFIAIVVHLRTPSTDERELGTAHARATDAQPARLDELELTVRWCRSQSDVHRRLRPVLRELALGLLRERRGVALDQQPERAEALLGPELYDLVRANRVEPADRHAPAGIDQQDIETLVSRLEHL